MNICACISIFVVYITQTHSSPALFTDLYYSDMEHGTGWLYKGYPYQSSNINYCAVGNCVYLSGDASITQSDISTFEYNSINLQYSITPYQLSSNDKCRVSYSIDDLNYQILEEYGQTSAQMIHLKPLNKDADNLASGISIRFEAISGGTPDSFRCYFDEIYVFGIHGTRHPTQSPSVQPTIHTNAPSLVPSATPSEYPSIAPSTHPSVSPTIEPTEEPAKPWHIYTSSNPTIDPTPSPSIQPTTNPLTRSWNVVTSRPSRNTMTISPTSVGKSTRDPLSTTENTGIVDIIPEENEANAFVDGTRITNNYSLWIIILACIFIIIMLVSWIYSTKIEKFKNDFYRLSSLIAAFIHILDTTAYLLFVYYITLQPDFTISELQTLQVLLISAVICIVLSVCIMLYQLHRHIKKWDKQSVETSQWISRNVSFLVFMSIVTLSPFTAVKLCRSHLFNLRQFSMPLTRSQSSKFQSQRLYTAILLQNVPQMVIEITFIFYLRKDSVVQNYDNIVYVAVTLTLLSIFMGIYEMTKIKYTYSHSDFISIEFDVAGIPNATAHRNRVKCIRDRISSLIGVNVNNLEVVRPSHIPKGLRVVINVGINHDPKKIAKNIGVLVVEAHENGGLNEIIESAWNLSQAPVIDNVAVI